MTEPTSKSQRLKNLWGEALSHYEQAKSQMPDLLPIVSRAAIFFCFQRVMFLGFKTLKAFLKEEGLRPLTPKQHLEMAAQVGWIPLESEDDWWILLMSWLGISEVYEEEQAEKLLEDILAHDFVIENLFETLS